MNRAARYCALAFACLFSGCSDETRIRWHSYIHSPSGVIHYSLDFASYKRGLFFGSCGPSTRSLKWRYQIELKGESSSYLPGAIELKDDSFHSLPIRSGSILVDRDKKTATIDLSPFAHNDVYRLEKED